MPAVPIFTRHVLVVIALVALALLAWKLTAVLMLVFAAVVVAAVIRSISTPLHRHTRLRDTWAVGLVSLVIAAVIIGGLVIFGKQLADQTDELWAALVSAWAKVLEKLAQSQVAASLLEQVKQASGEGSVAKVAKGTFTVFGSLADLLLVVVLGVYLAIDPRTYRDGLLMLLPKSARSRVGEAMDASGTALRKWLIGQLGAMIAVGILTALGLLLAGVPLAIPLGILAGVLDFVPVIGPFVAAVPGIIIAFAQGPQVALYAALVYLIVQFVEGNIVLPIAQKWALDIPPGVVVVAIVAFGVVFGLPGVLFAMPLAVVTMVMVQKLYVERLG